MPYLKRELSFPGCPAHLTVLAVPTCTRMHCITKNSSCQVSKVVIHRIRTFLFILYCVDFNNEGFLVEQSLKILQKLIWLACLGVRGEARGKQLVVLPEASDVTGSRKNKRFCSCIPET